MLNAFARCVIVAPTPTIRPLFESLFYASVAAALSFALTRIDKEEAVLFSWPVGGRCSNVACACKLHICEILLFSISVLSPAPNAVAAGGTLQPPHFVGQESVPLFVVLHFFGVAESCSDSFGVAFVSSAAAPPPGEDAFAAICANNNSRPVDGLLNTCGGGGRRVAINRGKKSRGEF